MARITEVVQWSSWQGRGRDTRCMISGDPSAQRVAGCMRGERGWFRGWEICSVLAARRSTHGSSEGSFFLENLFWHFSIAFFLREGGEVLCSYSGFCCFVPSVGRREEEGGAVSTTTCETPSATRGVSVVGSAGATASTLSLLLAWRGFLTAYSSGVRDVEIPCCRGFHYCSPLQHVSVMATSFFHC